MIDENMGDFLVGSVRWAHQSGLRQPADVLLIQLSPPDKHGYCSFGASIWDKKQAVKEAMNPLFELYGSDYILDPRVIASNDNMVAINSAMMVDLTGQIAAESIGPRMISSTGGQLAFAIGAGLSNNGQSITVLPATARGNTISRIVPVLEAGTIVTVPRTLADTIVTEYGIARLKGKTQRQRAQELIAIAHPDFREELTKESQRLYYP